MELRIVGTELPGRQCDLYGNVHVGIQVRREPEQIVRGDADTATFSATIEVVDKEGGPDFRGAAVQGRPGDRFVYLTWGNVVDDRFEMFRRAKLMFDAIPADTLASAQSSGVLTARLGLTDSCDMPKCAAIRPPAIVWGP